MHIIPPRLINGTMYEPKWGKILENVLENIELREHRAQSTGNKRKNTYFTFISIVVVYNISVTHITVLHV